MTAHRCHCSKLLCLTSHSVLVLFVFLRLVWDRVLKLSMLPLRTKTLPLLPPPTKTFLPLRLLLPLPLPPFPPAFALPSFRAKSGQLRRSAALSYSHLLQPPMPDGRCIRIPTPDGLGDSVVRARQLRAAALQLAAFELEHGSDPSSPARRPHARHRSSRPRQLAP